MEQAYLEQCLAEIGQSFDEGRNEIKQLLVLRKNGSAQELVKVCNWRGFQNLEALGFRR